MCHFSFWLIWHAAQISLCNWTAFSSCIIVVMYIIHCGFVRSAPSHIVDASEFICGIYIGIFPHQYTLCYFHIGHIFGIWGTDQQESIELKVWATAESWTFQLCAAHYNQSPQKGMMFHHLQTVSVNSLNKQDNRHIWLLWMSIQHNDQVHQFDCEVDSGAGCNIIPLYIYRLLFKDWRTGPPRVVISGYGKSPVENQGSCTAVLLTGCQTPQKAVFQDTETRGYLILCHELAQQIAYIYCPKSYLKLRQPPVTHTQLRAIAAKTQRFKKTSRRGQDLKCPRVQLLEGAVLINGKRHNLPITKEYILKEKHDVFNGIGTLLGDKYHITLKDYILVQHLQDQFQSSSNKHIKKSSGGYIMKESLCLYKSTWSGPIP